MTTATMTGIFLLFLLTGIGLRAMASISGWRDVLWALAITFSVVSMILLSVTLIVNGMWPWEPGFVEALT